ncbi:MAG TPA: DUF6797 domain-containing protein, partial [Lacipirellulaceae bacterium]
MTSFVLALALLPSVAWAQESVRPTTSALSKEYLQRWTPGGDTNAKDLPYPHVTAPYQSENDEDWIDDRWQLTQKGPFLSHSILLPGHDVGAKLVCVAAGPGKYLLYDLAAGSFVAGVTKAKLQTDPARFGLLKQPQLLGDVAFFAPADKVWRRGKRDSILAAGECDYQGLHLRDDRVLLVSRIAGVDVLESPLASDDEQTLTRELEIAPHDVSLWQAIAADVSELAVANDAGSATWIDRSGSPRRVVLDAATSGVELESDGKA